MIHVSKVKKVFHDSGVQISTNAINLIRDDFNRNVRRMANRCSDGNVKRLTNDTYHIALGHLDNYLK
ncbi:hypothetical protein CMI47_16590 [Candidatus Pacearchaeota archaeon]|jgi:hypothetical protein|nr:hypothetical protein [Candidatus Pacearchaeota archaeon]